MLNCSKTDTTRNTTYNINMAKPISLDICHLQTAIVTTIARSITKRSTTEQNKLSLLTPIDLLYTILYTNQGTGRLHTKKSRNVQ